MSTQTYLAYDVCQQSLKPVAGYGSKGRGSFV